MAYLTGFVFLLYISATRISAYFKQPETNGALSLAAPNCQSELKPLEYKLFSSTTLYENSRAQLQNQSTQEFVPDAFSSRSLLNEHQALLKQSCKPIIFYFLGRHAARFPKDEKIEKYNKNLNELKQRLKGSSSFIDKCPEKLAKFLNWTSKLEPKLSYLITELGGREEQAIASRFKEIYPEFFSTQTASVDLGVTSKIRTSETGVQFMKLVENFSFPGCESTPTNDVDQAGFDPEKILSSNCYKALMNKEVEEFLQFHERCKKSLKKLKGINPDDDGGQQQANNNKGGSLVDKIKSPEAVRSIADKVSAKLGLEVDSKIVDSIAQMCMYEIAIRKHSVWCSLLDEQDMRMIDYVQDTSAYIKDSYGPESNVKQACPLIKDLLDVFQNATTLPDGKRNAYFYFSHDHALKKVLANFGLFKDEASYSEQRIDEFVQNGNTPMNRNYRVAFSVPFSGNFAFALYRCPDSQSDGRHKLLISLNERPIRIAGCDVACDVKQFIETYKSAYDCNLDKICPL